MVWQYYRLTLKAGGKNDYMIQILESKKLIEKQLDKVLTGPMTGVKDISVVKYLATYGLDIENTNFVETDPSELKKDQNILFIFAMVSSRFDPKTRERISNLYYRTCLYTKGQKQFAGVLRREDEYVDRNGNILPTGNKDLSAASFNFLVKNCYAAYVLDDELVWSLEKRRQRRAAKQGSIDRHDPNEFYDGAWNSNLSLDKSGYVIDKDKYKKMLAVVNKDSYVKYFDAYINLYNEVQEFLTSVQNAKFSLDNDSEGPELNYTNQKKLTNFIQQAKQNLAGFAGAFRRNDQRDLVAYSDRIKKDLNQENEIRSIINK